jgi:exodeoxyribonuclease-1
MCRWPHPTNKNEVICWDLAADPAELRASASKTCVCVCSRQAELPEGVSRLPIKSIHVNKSPMVVGSLKTLSPAMAEKWVWTWSWRCGMRRLPATCPT